MECRQGVSESKEHHERFKQPFGGKEGGLPFISFLDADIIVPPSYIKFGKEGAPSQPVNYLRDEGRDVAVPSGPLVEGAIVQDQAQFPVLLLDKEEVCCIGALGLPDHLSAQVLFRKVVALYDFVLFPREESPREHGWGAWEELNGMVPDGMPG